MSREPSMSMEYTTARNTGFSFRPDVEGLRALAVLLVLFYHARLGFTGGFVGVDVFFVVSGFLITSLLLDESSKGSVSLARFWARRARRLLPASALVLLVTAVAAQFMLEPTRLAGLAGDVVSASTFSANVRFTFTNGDYLSGLSLPSPLLHFWSLAVEEQFYLLWPLLLAALTRFRRFRGVLAVSATLLFAVSLFWSWKLTPASPAAAYFLLPTRAWELLAGALLALIGSRVLALPAALRGVLGWAGLVVLGVVSWSFGEETVFPGLAALLPVLATLALLMSGPLAGPGRLLSLRPFQWAGSRSYAIYLWHWPLLVLLEAYSGPLPVAQRLLVLGLSLVVAEISFRLLEQPLRTSRWLAASNKRSLTTGLAMSVSVLASGVVLLALAPSSVNSVGVAASVAAPSVVPTQAAVVDAPVTTPPLSTVPASSQEIAPTPSTDTAPATTVALSPEPIDPGRVLLIGDSTLAPLRWFEGADVSLQGFDWVLDAESCRRLELSSCKGREGRTPKSAVPVLDAATQNGVFYDTVVVMGGYHSTPKTIGREFDALVEAVRRNGAERMVLLNFRESLAFPAPGSKGKLSVYTGFNETINSRLAGGGFDDVIVLDWNGFSATALDWFRSDGIHVNLPGALGLGSFLSDALNDLGALDCTGGLCRLPSTAAPADALLGEFSMAYTDQHCYEIGSSRKPVCRRDKLA